MKLVGLEFWGQRVGAELHPLYPGESKSFNKKYIYGLISDQDDPPASYPPPPEPPEPGEIPVGTIVSIKYPEEVQVYNSGFGGGKTIHAIPNRPHGDQQPNMYGCLFEMAPELNVQMALPAIPTLSGRYNVVLNRDKEGDLEFDYIKSSEPLPSMGADTINRMFNKDYSALGYTAFKAEEAFVDKDETVPLQLQNANYNDIFSGLQDLYMNGTTVSIKALPDPSSVLGAGVGELFNKVAQNVDVNINDLVDRLYGIPGGSTGGWTYEYSITDNSTGYIIYLANIRYEIYYNYVLLGDNKLKCDYSITFNYRNYTDSSGIIVPEFFKGTMTFNYEVEGEEEEVKFVTTVEFSEFYCTPVYFNNIASIDLSDKKLAISNARWNLGETMGQPEIGDLLTKIGTDEKPVFPLPEKEAEIGNAAAVTEINKFYGWMFSNFAFYVEE
jgi:hypothetical protein